MTLKRHVGVILFVYLLSLSARVCESHTVSSSSVVRGGDLHIILYHHKNVI